MGFVTKLDRTTEEEVFWGASVLSDASLPATLQVLDYFVFFSLIGASKDVTAATYRKRTSHHTTPRRTVL